MKKGFTLIELLAIIVILAIVALITVPIIGNIINKSKKVAAKDEVYAYIDAVESNAGLGALDPNYIKLENKCYSVADPVFNNLKIKGTKPTVGQICINKNRVTSGVIIVDGYKVSIRDGEVYRIVKGSSIEDFSILYNKVSVGDYIKMTPNPDSTKTYTSLTYTSSGYTLDAQTLGLNPTAQTTYALINGNKFVPAELNLWRVININEDGSIDAVSEYTSSTAVMFQGETGYKNFVGVLDEIASLYENSDYTLSTRMIGYKEGCQTKFLSSISVDSDTPITVDNDYESIGGGDVCYSDDVELVYSALGKYSAYKVNTTTKSEYFVSSRFYGGVANDYRLNYIKDIVSDTKFNPIISKTVRPIITINGTLENIQGEGTKQKPFMLES